MTANEVALLELAIAAQGECLAHAPQHEQAIDVLRQYCRHLESTHPETITPAGWRQLRLGYVTALKTQIETLRALMALEFAHAQSRSEICQRLGLTESPDLPPSELQTVSPAEPSAGLT